MLAMVINFIIAHLVISFPSITDFQLFLNIDGMGMLLAQWLILLGVEWLTFQIHMAYLELERDRGRERELV